MWHNCGAWSVARGRHVVGPVSYLLGVWLLVAAPVVRADDWSQWRGPSRNGVSAETGLLRQWPPEGPKLVWQIKDLGNGYSTPAAVGDRLYVLSNEDMDNEHVQARSTADGQQIWTTRLGKVGPNAGPQYPAARSTPTVDGELLYALGSDGDLACVESATGKVRWQKSLRSDFGGQPGRWAYAESPLIDGEVLICTPGGSEATVIALDKRSGDEIWKSTLAEADKAAYASPIVVEVAGVKQYVLFLEKGVVGLEAATGKELWRYGRTAEGSPANIPSPVAHQNFIYTAASRSGGGLIEITGGENEWKATEVYFANDLPKAIGGVVKLDDYLYGASEALMCVEFASGEVKWQERSLGAASICYADGRLYLHGESNGDVALVEATPEAYRELGKFTPPDTPDRGRGRAWAYPVVANGRLYIRDVGCLWCYDIQQQ